MLTIVGILTFIIMINRTFEILKARKVFIFQHFRFYEYNVLSWIEHDILFITLGPDFSFQSNHNLVMQCKTDFKFG